MGETFAKFQQISVYSGEEQSPEQIFHKEITGMLNFCFWSKVGRVPRPCHFWGSWARASVNPLRSKVIWKYHRRCSDPARQHPCDLEEVINHSSSDLQASQGQGYVSANTIPSRGLSGLCLMEGGKKAVWTRCYEMVSKLPFDLHILCFYVQHCFTMNNSGTR